MYLSGMDETRPRHDDCVIHVTIGSSRGKDSPSTRPQLTLVTIKSFIFTTTTDQFSPLAFIRHTRSAG